mgnify:CR=1 FL=1|jgi:hypothetical protein
MSKIFVLNFNKIALDPILSVGVAPVGAGFANVLEEEI